MGLFNKVFHKSSSDLGPIPPPPKGEEMDVPPLPPEQEMQGSDLPNISPDTPLDVRSPPDLPDLNPPDIPSPKGPDLPDVPTPSSQDFKPKKDATEDQDSDISDLKDDDLDLDLDDLKVPEFDERPEPVSKGLDLPVEEVPEPVDRKSVKGPIFVKVDDFRHFIESQSLIKNNLKEANNIITRLNEIMVEEDKEFSSWRQNLETIQKKISQVERKVF